MSADRISCERIFGRRDFKSYSEFYLALCMGAVCITKGCSLDMSSMIIEPEVLPKDLITYFKYLVGMGSIYIEGVQASEESSSLYEPILYFDTTTLASCRGKLYKQLDDRYVWTYSDFIEQCSSHMDKVGLGQLPGILMHIVADFLLDMFIGEKSEKNPLEIVVTDMLVKNTTVYVNLISCGKTFDFFNDMIKLNIDFSDFKVDLDYSILCNNGRAAKRNHLWTVGKKREFYEKEGFKEGLIAILWTRKGMCASNPDGKVVDASVVKLGKLSKDSLEITKIAINKTKEELLDDYREIPEDQQHLFSDILEGSPNLTHTSVSLYDLGINNYFHMEDSFITLIDERSTVTKKITIDGNSSYVELSNIDAIYWLLCQYSIDFDRELYRRVYNKGEELLWDKFGSDFED